MTLPFTRDVIFDIGMSEGDDTDFYLKKGFRVLGVEADPSMQEQLKMRFAAELASDRLRILNRAAFSRSGETIAFLISGDQGHSHIATYKRPDDDTAKPVTAETVSWADLISVWGVPHYCKVDIEGAETSFLTSMRNSPLAAYISVECHAFDPIEQLHELGYRSFRLVHQNSHNAFLAPNPPLEGNLVRGHDFKHASGYFGRELWGHWLTYRDTVTAFEAILTLRRCAALPHIWWDCHARLSSPGS